MTLVQQLNEYIDTEAYKRGKYKGEAPGYRYRRGMNHFRLRKQDGKVIVRYWNTDILVVDGDRVLIHCDGYIGNSTTRMRINDLFNQFKVRAGVGKRSVHSKNQMCLGVPGKVYAYYDGITFDAQTQELLSEARRFKAVRIDRDESKEFKNKLALSGFKGVFPLLWATASEPSVRHFHFRETLQDTLTDEDYAEDWPMIVTVHAFDRTYDYYNRNYKYTKRDRKAVWNLIMKKAKEDMYRLVDSDTTVIAK